MLTLKKSTLKKSALFIASLALLVVLVALFAPNAVSFAEGATCNADGVCDPTVENNDSCPEDCHCTDNGVVDPGEGCGCRDMICEDEELFSACGTPAGANGECPSGTASDGTTKSLSEWYGVCWDACECEGICTEKDEKEAKPGSCWDAIANDASLPCPTGFCDSLWPGDADNACVSAGFTDANTAWSCTNGTACGWPRGDTMCIQCNP